jgi:hypothetical protein
MDGQEPLDHPQHESHPAFAVLELKPPGRQAATTPSLNRLARDVESLGNIVNGHHRLGGERFPQIQRFTDLLDQQSQIVLKGHAGEKGLVDFLWAESGDSEDDEIVGVCLARLDFEQKIFRSRELREATLLRSEGKLPTQISDLVDPELRHDGYYPFFEEIGQGETEGIDIRENRALDALRTRQASPAAKRWGVQNFWFSLGSAIV